MYLISILLIVGLVIVRSNTFIENNNIIKIDFLTNKKITFAYEL